MPNSLADAPMTSRLGLPRLATIAKGVPSKPALLHGISRSPPFRILDLSHLNQALSPVHNHPFTNAVTMSPAASEKTMRQYVATKKGGPFQVVKGPYPIPGPDEICIRNRAVALNALDLKSLHHGMMVQSYPEIFGIDTAGVVEVVGSNVTDFKAGDAVMSSAGLGGRKGAFQDITTVPAHFASRKPSTWSFAQACSAP